MENPKTGELMSKSKGTGVFLDVSSNDMYGQVMAQPDEMIRILFVNNTYLSLEEIDKIMSLSNPKDSKQRLAFEITKIFHGEDNAKKAEQNFANTFKDGGLPEDIDEITAVNGELLSDLSVKAGLVKSKGEFRRLVLEKAVSNQETGDKINDQLFKVISTTIFKIGKRRFLKVIIK
jgi:tyrosyl-tRNA synthetase